MEAACARERRSQVGGSGYSIGFCLPSVVTYSYDGRHRRIRKTVEGETDIDYDYYYNTSWQVVEVRKEGAAYKQYVWDTRYIDAPVCRFRNNDGNADLEETLYYTNDANMNVTALVNTSGTIVERCAYNPYGEVKFYNEAWGGESSTSSYDNEILFAGYRLDTETSLHHVRNRYYHSTLGRWATRDPAGYIDGMNLYEYVRTNPISALDPAGLKTWTLATAKAEVAKKIAKFRRKGYNLAADLMQHFLDRKGPTEYTPTQANIDEVKQHGRGRILDEIFNNIGGRTNFRPPLGQHKVNITHPGKGPEVESNIRWKYHCDNQHMWRAYGGARLGVTGRATTYQGVETTFVIFTHEPASAWRWGGKVHVRLGDFYVFTKGGFKTWRRSFLSDAYSAAVYLEKTCGWKGFYHEMEFDLKWQWLRLPDRYRKEKGACRSTP